MKRILSLIIISVMLLGLCACNSTEEIEQDATALLHMEIIDGLGISLENRTIVGCRGENNHLTYIVVEYDEKVQKSSETTYYFCFNESVYDNMSEEFKNEPEFTGLKDKCYFTFKSDMAITGSYAKDVERIKKEYTIK